MHFYKYWEGKWNGKKKWERYCVLYIDCSFCQNIKLRVWCISLTHMSIRSTIRSIRIITIRYTLSCMHVRPGHWLMSLFSMNVQCVSICTCNVRIICMVKTHVKQRWSYSLPYVYHFRISRCGNRPFCWCGLMRWWWWWPLMIQNARVRVVCVHWTHGVRREQNNVKILIVQPFYKLKSISFTKWDCCLLSNCNAIIVPFPIEHRSSMDPWGPNCSKIGTNCIVLDYPLIWPN